MTKTTPEPAPSRPCFSDTPVGGRLFLNVNCIRPHTFRNPPSPIMLPHRGGGGGPGWVGRCTSEDFSPGRVTQGVKAIPLYPAKA
ncbi:hypothetical protein AVEN_180106-1 [Araneus ventricosus]|uniref:Uncharacterized protein n=1 Tax=Araneus ventricosus TaxID=182803 RepID=A0A4Y2EKB0_ARAVE|nr:hypothetical protein AVEN_180106-1 [Araneus ventricosus]